MLLSAPQCSSAIYAHLKGRAFSVSLLLHVQDIQCACSVSLLKSNKTVIENGVGMVVVEAAGVVAVMEG